VLKLLDTGGTRCVEVGGVQKSKDGHTLAFTTDPRNGTQMATTRETVATTERRRPPHPDGDVARGLPRDTGLRRIRVDGVDA